MSHTQPQTLTLKRPHVFTLDGITCVNLGTRSFAAKLCSHERQMRTDILPHRFPPTPLMAPLLTILILYAWWPTWSLVWLESMYRLEIPRFLCRHPHQVEARSPNENTFLNPSTNSDFAASNHTSKDYVMVSGRIGASLGKHHSPAKTEQNGARSANGAHAAPPPGFPHTAWLFATYVHVMHGWGWPWGEHGGGKENWPRFGGFQGWGRPVIRSTK